MPKTFPGKSNNLIYSVMFIMALALNLTVHNPASADELQEVKNEMNAMLEAWYPTVIDDEHGGYISSFSHDWKMTGSQEKMIVTQARHLWTLSKATTLFPDKEYQTFALHGVQFLENHMWDDAYGGFFQLVTREGEPIPDSEDGESYPKTLYGNAYAIYGLAAYYGATGDQESLELAKQTFHWLEASAHDKEYGGYFQQLERNGTPKKGDYPKDYNAMHILEALTELYVVWPDELVRKRLEEIFHIFRDRMISDRGYTRLYFSEDWTHLSYQDASESVIRENMGRDHISPGTDVEIAYFLLEAARALGMEDDPETWRVAKLMTDHSLQTGWDAETGGFYNTGYYFPGDDHLTIVNDAKSWWPQGEGLNTLLIMAGRYPDDPNDYLGKFKQQWEYIKEYIIDHEHGGWYSSGLDTRPDSMNARKSHIWKGNYHSFRALMEVMERLSGKNK
jgi:mannobiose 2-epimerase